MNILIREICELIFEINIFLKGSGVTSRPLTHSLKGAGWSGLRLLNLIVVPVASGTYFSQAYEIVDFANKEIFTF